VREQFIAHAGIDPFPGTLNLRIDADADRDQWARARAGRISRIVPPTGEGCEALCVPAMLDERVPAAIVIPDVAGYPPDQVEIVAAVPLRATLAMQPGDEVTVSAAEVTDVCAVVFDVDGTLVNSLEGIHQAASRAAALFGYDVPYEAVRRAMNAGESLWDLVLPEDKRGDRELSAILRQQTMRHWPEVLATSVRVFPGLEDTLHRLRAAGIRMAICTGSRGESFLPLERAGLMEYFDPIITANDVRRPKPHPDGLQICLERLGCKPEEAVYVGDSRHDIDAARAAGMRAIGVLTGAADSAALSAAGADRLIAAHHRLAAVLQV
jgi:2-phosphoglycolate phosphatase